jgi:hypothetical protein
MRFRLVPVVLLLAAAAALAGAQAPPAPPKTPALTVHEWGTFTSIANGLYEKEAQAMVDTWSDSWFEEGARLLYIVPRQAVDAILPLSITPAPLDVARVLVGRMELVTPVTRRAVRLALAINDRITLEKYGRFVQPIGIRVLAEVSPLDREVMADRLKAVASPWAATTNSCR